MSIESAKSFLERMKTDADFKTKVLSLPSAGEERKKFVTGAGFDFNFAELQQATATVTLNKNDQIGPEDLDQIAAACIGLSSVAVVNVVGTPITSPMA